MVWDGLLEVDCGPQRAVRSSSALRAALAAKMARERVKAREGLGALEVLAKVLDRALAVLPMLRPPVPAYRVFPHSDPAGLARHERRCVVRLALCAAPALSRGAGALRLGLVHGVWVRHLRWREELKIGGWRRIWD